MWDLVGNPEDRFSHNEAHFWLEFPQSPSPDPGWASSFSCCLAKIASFELSSGVSVQVRYKPGCMARGLKFFDLRIEEEVLYFLCSENKGADQLQGYRRSFDDAKQNSVVIKWLCTRDLLVRWMYCYIKWSNKSEFTGITTDRYNHVC